MSPKFTGINLNDYIIIHMGSVKDLVVIEEPTKESAGIGDFIFSDRYSVFDWGEMPDHIKNKGKALCLMGAYFFEKLEEKGMKTHYIGLVENGKIKKIDEIEEGSNIMRINLLRVLKPGLKDGKYDYSIYKKERNNFLIPLEIIYRNSLPAGSSVFRRLKEGNLSLNDLGLKKMPEPGEKLQNPIIDVSTKLEVTDRYIKWDEAKEIVCMSDEEIEEIKEMTLRIDEIITREAKKARIFNEDGKVEYGFDESRKIMVVDVLGTPDECRFTIDNIPVSKEVARIFYRNTEWYEKVKEAKKRNREKWKNVTPPPPKLPQKLVDLISMMYQATCNEIVGIKFFDVPSLSKIISEMRDFLADFID